MRDRYNKFNPKRKVAKEGEFDPDFLKEMKEKVKYTGNPEHKRNPGDFGLTPPAQARRGKTLCDIVNIFTKKEALRLLQEGISQGTIERRRIDGWPKLIWAVTKCGVPVEAQRDSEGSYHGYPMPDSDPMADEIKKLWKKNE